MPRGRVRVRLPDGVINMSRRGPEWAEFVERLPSTTRALLEEWELRPDGWMMHGNCALIVPVVTATGRPAVLKVSFPDEESEHEHLALSHWGGRGAVRLERADPSRRAMLLEALRDVSLREAWDIEACTAVGELYAALHIPAFAQLRSLARLVERWGNDLAALPRNAPLPRRLVEQAASLARDFATDRATTGTLIHGDLHYDNVLSSDREAWLAIDPKPLDGDPHFEPAPMLWNRFEELASGTTGVRDGIRRRFHTLVDVGGLDEDRARDWVVVRMMNHAAWRLLDPAGVDRSEPDEAWLTMCVTIAKAVQD